MGGLQKVYGLHPVGISAIQTNHIVFLGQRHKADYHVARITEKKCIQNYGTKIS